MNSDFTYSGGTGSVAETEILSVGDLTQCIRSIIEGEDLFRDVWVRGEISNLTRHSSGHVYFSLKDERALIRCVVWQNSARLLNFELADGMRVIAHGRVTVYEKQGQYQLTVSELRPDGIGALYEAFEELKRKLSAEGLFDDSRKKPLPTFPSTIAIVTSPTGAAVQDMVSVARRRMPSVNLLLVPALVQGEGSADSVVESLRSADSAPEVEVIVVGRGGGSIEDLWTFNEEAVVRAICSCETPVVSAVGHQTDYTLSDFAADRRAATPSAAMELLLPDRRELLARLDTSERRLSAQLTRRLGDARSELDRLTSSASFRYPLRIVAERWQDLDGAQGSLESAFRKKLTSAESVLSEASARLHALSPLSVLERGYAIVRRAADGSVVGHISDVEASDKTETLVSGGILISQVEEVREGWGSSG